MKKTVTLLFAVSATLNSYAQNTYPTSGNVGVGTNNPQSILSVVGNNAGIFKSLALTNYAVSNGAGTAIYMGYDAQGGNPYGVRLLQTGYPTSTRAGAFAIQRHSANTGDDWLTSLHIDFNGNVGIGTSTPTAPLNIQGGGISTGIANISNTLTAIINTANPPITLGIGYVSSDNPFIQAYNSVTNSPRHTIINPFGGSVGIGTTVPDATLAVKGNIHANEVKVDLNVPGPDYVFETGYKLPELKTIETYITKNRHLPEIPSAKEMEKNGVNLSEMNMLLLKKVEELTLHLIAQKKDIEILKKQLLINNLHFKN